MDVGLRVLTVAACAETADRPALGDGSAARDGERRQMRQRHGVAVVGRDRERDARARDGAGEGDRAATRREHDGAGGPGNVDAAMLAAGIRMGGVEDERLENFAVGRPRPRSCSWSADQRRHGNEQEHATHGTPP